MLIYYFLPIWVVICSSVYFTRIKNKNLIFLILVFLLLFPIMAFRKETIGTDLPSYINIFNSLGKNLTNSTFFNDKNMILYSVYNIMLYSISSDPRILIFSNSLIICVLFFIFLYRNCKDNLPFSTFLLVISYFYFAAFNISRQFIAIGIASNALYYLLNKNRCYNPVYKFVFLVCLAGFVHFTALILLLVLPLFFIKRNTYVFSYSILVPIVLVVFLLIGGSLIPIVLPAYADYFSDDFQFSFQNYSSQGRSLILYLFFLALIIGLFIYYKTKRISLNRKEVVIFSLFILYTLINVAGVHNPLFARISYYFSFSLLMFVPLFCNKFTFSEKVLAKVLVSCVLLIPFVIQLQGNYNGIIPYETFF